MERITPILSECQEQQEEYIFDTHYYFTISSSLEISDVEFLRFGYSDECKRKVKEVFMKMNNWTPGKIYEENVYTRYLFPLKIKWSN